MKQNYLNYYQLLGVTTNATTEEILKAYKEKAKEYHPDKNDGHHTANTLFQYVQQAKDTLTDPQKRLEYDYISGVKQRPEPKAKVIYSNNSNSNGEIAGAVIGAAAVGLLVGLFLGSDKD